jgi:hypothetical protein
LKNYSVENFLNVLKDVNWDNVLKIENVDVAWDTFKTSFLAVIDKVAPVKEVRLKQRTEPWFDSELLELIQERDKTLYKYKKSNRCDQELYIQYKKLRNKVQYKTKKARESYFSSKVEEQKNTPKKLWQTLKSLGTSNTGSTKTSKIGLKIGDEICFDKQKVAEKFNSFFTTVASTLVEKLPPRPNIFGETFINNFYKHKVAENEFGLSAVNEELICSHLKKICISKATGLDKLPARFIKDAADVIAPCITHIVNLSINLGDVPKELKTARVVPLFKKNDKTEAGNYRPVSILSIISKIMERVVFDQFEAFLKEKSLIYKFQSGFRSSFSTDTCLIHLTDHIRKECDKGNYTGMVMLDLQKAFDTVDHGILLTKLRAMGVQSNSVKWFQSYLSNRSQFVEIGGIQSGSNQINCGVPQGSILGPLLFLAYVNDMSAAVNCKLLLYADDSALMVSNKDIGFIQSSLSQELESVSKWLIDNKLSLHLGKTESILFGTKRKLKQTSKLDIRCNGSKILSKSSVKYLGVDLDQSLNGEITGNKILKKVHARLAFLYRKSKCLNIYTKKLLVSALIQCHYDYACSTWYSGLSAKTTHRLQTAQNKIIRYVLGLNPRSHLGYEEFRKVGWLPVKYRVDQIKLNHMHKIVGGNCPDYMKEGMVMLRSMHNHNTRHSAMNFSLPNMGSNGQNSFQYTGIKLWNSLPIGVQKEEERHVFKHKVKQYLFDTLRNVENSDFVW